MIKFFRRIRQNLLMENKTGKYFQYAVGEIVLVVIGILIALSLNNLNEKKKLNEKENKFLKEIANDLKITQKEINEDLQDLQRNLNSSLIIRDLILSKGKLNDSLIKHFYFTMDLETLDAKSSTYESLKSFGLDLIGNDSLQKQITDIYEDVIPKLKSEFITVSRAAIKLEDLLIPHLSVDSMRLKKSQWAAYRFIDYELFLQSNEYWFVLQRSIPKRQLQIKSYKWMEEYIENCITFIESELNEL